MIYFNQQKQKIDKICRPIVVNPQCITGSFKFAEGRKICNIDVDNYSQAYGEIVSCLSKVEIIQT